MLRVRVLGGFEVELDGVPLVAPPSQRPWALLGHLATLPAPVGRGELAARFWPDVLDASARASLRSAIWTLRRAIGGHISSDRDVVGLRDDGDLSVDLREFDRLAAAGDAEAALALCRGELLAGFDDEWALIARDANRERVLDLLEQLAAAAEERGEQREAIEWTRRQVARDPLGEEAHRRLIARLAAAGDRAAALRVFRALSERLRRELAVAPSPATRELVERLRSEPAPVAQAARARASGLVALVGREVELARLEQLWRRVGAGTGAVAVVRGEAGIGKTRLATELLLRADGGGARTAMSAALDLGGAAPLSLWAELIRDLAPALAVPDADAAWPGDLAPLAPELAASFGRSAAGRRDVPPDLERTRLFEAVVALLAWASSDRPLLLVIEDIHAGDGPSLELVGYAARRAVQLPLLLVLTRRELPRRGDADRLEQALRARGVLAVELTLGPLAADSLAALARSAAPLADPDVETIVEQAEGNALLALESARGIARGDAAPGAGIRGSVRATGASLSPGARALTDFAAVAGRPLERGETELLPLERHGEAAAEALDSGLLVGTAGRVGFRHALLREAAYEELPEPRRQWLHETWARALLAREQRGGVRRPAEAARHLRLGGCPTEASDELARAAADARAVGVLAAAGEFLEEAIELDPRRPELLLELAEVEAWQAHRAPAEAAFLRARELLAEADALELVRAWLRRARWNHGTICVPRAVLESCRTALELLDAAGESATAERREALAACAWAEAIAGDVTEAERLLAELHRLIGNAPRDDLVTYDVGHARALALMRRGRFVDAYAPSVAAGEAVARAGRPDLAYGCWINAAGAAAASQDYERALEFLDRGADAVARKGLESLELHMLAARSFALLRLGRIAEAAAVTAAEREIAERLGQPELIAMAAHDQGRVALEQADWSRAALLLAEALAGEGPLSRPLTRLALAEAFARGGEPGRAEAEVRATVLEPIRASDFPDALVPRLARVQGLIALARGDRDGASDRLRESVAGWERQVERSAGADAMTAVLADLGRPVVGLVEPARELARARADLELAEKGEPHAVVP